MLGLAEKKVAVIEITDLAKAEQEEGVENAISKLKGVEACVAMSADHAVWVAYDASLCGIKQITAALGGTKLKAGRSYVLEALPKLSNKQERCVVYTIVPPGSKQDEKIASAMAAFTGVSAYRLDRMFNMLIINYDPSQLKPEQLIPAIVKAGYPAGLPGGELTQPPA